MQRLWTRKLEQAIINWRVWLANPQFFKNVKEDNDEYLVANTSTTEPENRITDEYVDRATEDGPEGKYSPD